MIKFQSEAQTRRRKGEPVKQRGRFTLRLSYELQEACDWRAYEAGISLNDWITHALTEHLKRTKNSC